MPAAVTYDAGAYPALREGVCLFQLTLGAKLSRILHNHTFYEIICLVDGTCTQEIGGVPQTMSAGDFAVLRPPDVHRFTAQSENANVAAFSILPEEMRKFILAFGLDDAALAGIWRIPVEELPGFGQLCAELLARDAGECAAAERLAIGKLMCCVLSARSRALPQALPGTFGDAVRAMNRLENAREGVTAFLRLSCFSHAQLCRLTRRFLGATPGGYVTGIRMKYAREMIAAGNGDLASVAEAVGYDSYSHFCLVFRETYGTTPAQLRRDALSKVRTV